MLKDSILALVDQKKADKLASVQGEVSVFYDALKSDIQALPDDPAGGDVETLRQQVADLQSQLSLKQTELDAARSLLLELNADAKEVVLKAQNMDDKIPDGQ